MYLATCFVRTKLMSVAEEEVYARTAAPAVRSFLPPAMVQAATAAPATVTLTAASSVFEGLSNRGMGSNGRVQVKGEKKPKASWGCCIDCVSLRASVAWEKSHGALCLLRSVLELGSSSVCADINLNNVWKFDGDTKMLLLTVGSSRRDLFLGAAFNEANFSSLLGTVSVHKTCSVLQNLVDLLCIDMKDPTANSKSKRENATKTAKSAGTGNIDKLQTAILEAVSFTLSALLNYSITCNI